MIPDIEARRAQALFVLALPDNATEIQILAALNRAHDELGADAASWAAAALGVAPPRPVRVPTREQQLRIDRVQRARSRGNLVLTGVRVVDDD